MCIFSQNQGLHIPAQEMNDDDDDEDDDDDYDNDAYFDYVDDDNFDYVDDDDEFFLLGPTVVHSCCIR